MHPFQELRPVAKFQYCFNTSTIRGQKLSLVEEIDIVAGVALALVTGLALFRRGVFSRWRTVAEG